ncbi:response regulator [uncultured Maribacter sp.]|uniref:response regulator n=1 Tax=uncultured Maribacter sp. TaxID=431308 RepID=UPI00260ADCE3|nr:response regulator [uncultured Maribacter sp.]
MSSRKVLIVEDEPFLCDAYKLVFKQIKEVNKNFDFKIDVCNTLDKAKELIILNNNPYTIAIIDIRLRDVKKASLICGDYLGQQIRQRSLDTKIIFVTSVVDNYMFYKVFKKISPEGFMIKSEINYDTFKKDLLLILQNKNRYTESVLSFIKNEMQSKSSLDDIDREILFHLSNGAQLNNLSKYVPLSLSGIERRKRKIAEKLGLKKANVQFILEKASEYNLV